jgi:Tol biopolymer transport system component
VMNADGTGIKRLTNAPEEDRDPAWSPVASP